MINICYARSLLHKNELYLAAKMVTSIRGYNKVVE